MGNGIDPDDIDRLKKWTKGQKSKSNRKPKPKPKPRGKAGKDSKGVTSDDQDLLKRFQEEKLRPDQRASASQGQRKKEADPQAVGRNARSGDPRSQSRGRPQRPRDTPGKQRRSRIKFVKKLPGKSKPSEARNDGKKSPRRKKRRRGTGEEAAARTVAWDEGSWAAPLVIPLADEPTFAHPEYRLLAPDTGQRIELHIGVDAGTSGIRVSCSRVETGVLALSDFGPNQTHATRFSAPAVVGVEVDGDARSVRFGNRALTLPLERRFTSFKAGLLYPEVRRAANRKWSELGLPGASAFKAPTGPSVSDLFYAASIAWCLKRASPHLPHPVREAFCTLSVGAPLDGTGQVRARFARAFAAAVLMTPMVDDEMSIDAMVSLFARCWEEGKERAEADIEERRVEVRPESVLVIGAIEELITDGRTFIVADIGASTTEFAVVRKASGKLHNWVSNSFPVGVDQLDALIIEESSGGGPGDLLRQRINRVSEGSVDPGALQHLSDTLAKCIHATLHAAYKLNPDPPSWADIHIAVAGGGSNIPELVQALRRGVLAMHAVQTVHSHHLAYDGQLTIVGASRRPVERHERAEVACALGIARPPDDDMEYSDQGLSPVIPEAADPLADQRRAARSKWL